MSQTEAKERHLLAARQSDRLRQDILQELDPYPEWTNLPVGTVYISPTKWCPVGCEHCNFASLPARGAQRTRESFHSADAQARLLRFVNQLDAWKIVLSGGGEPLLEPALVERLIESAETARLEEIEVVTSGMWGKTPASALKVLTRLARAYRRRAHPSAVKLVLRLSVDWFHRQAMGLTPILHILRLLDTPEFSDIDCYIRSVLLQNDTTIQALALAIQGELSPLIDYQQTLTLPGGRRILVYAKNLILDGRLNRQKLATLPVALPPASAISEFSRRLRGSTGRFIPGLTYSGPVVRHHWGLSLDILHDGGIRILETTAPDNVPSLYEEDWPTARARLLADPLTIYLLEDGPEALAGLMQEIRPDALQLAQDTNQLYFIVEKLLNTADARLWATVQVLLLQRARGSSYFDDHLLREAIQYLQAIESRGSWFTKQT